MTAPEPRPAGLDSNVRGLAVLGVALLVGFLLLLNAGPSGGDSSAAPDDSAPVTTADLGTDTTAATTTTTSTPSSGRTPSEVKVLVLNGGGPAGSAATTSSTIEAAGYTMGEPDNSPVTVTETTFYYLDDYQVEATSVANLLGQTPDVVKPLAGSGLESAAGDANVLVVLGPNASPVESPDSSETTTTTTAN